MDFSCLVTLASRADLSLLRKWTVFYRKGTSAYHLRAFLLERAFYPQYAVLFPSYTGNTGRIHSPGPSGLFHATNFSRVYLPLHERTFPWHALRARIVLCYKKRTFDFILEDPGTNMIFDQYVRTFLPTSDTDGPLPNGRGHFLFKRTIPHTVRT